MTRTDIAYQPVRDCGGDDESGKVKEKITGERGRDDQENAEVGEKGGRIKPNNIHHQLNLQLKQRLREQQKETIREENDEEVVVERIDDDEDADSNNNSALSTSSSPSSSTGSNTFLRRTMSFLATLPRKLISYVREVFYTPQQRWSRVGHDDSDESEWSSGDEAGTSRTNRQKRHAGKQRDRVRAKATKAVPPPIAPKPKRKESSGTSGSSNPPSSPDTTTPDFTPPASTTEISFDDIAIETPQLKTYKRIHGPQGRRRPQRYSNQSEARQSDLRQSDLQLDAS